MLVGQGKLGQIIEFFGTYAQDSLSNPTLPITWRHIDKFSESGALGDPGSHPLSVSQFVLRNIESVNAASKTVIKQMPMSLGSLELTDVENDDLINILANYENGAVSILSSNRVAAGKNYLMYEIQGTEGTVYYSSERMNEVKAYFASDNSTDRGFRTIFLGPDHQGYSAFYPAAEIASGYNGVKVLGAHELLSAVSKGTSYMCDFEFGARID